MLPLLVQGLGVPRSVWAGCNHLVSSDSERLLNIHPHYKLVGARG
jgi:hypothetical protein